MSKQDKIAKSQLKKQWSLRKVLEQTVRMVEGKKKGNSNG